MGGVTMTPAAAAVCAVLLLATRTTISAAVTALHLPAAFPFYASCGLNDTELHQQADSYPSGYVMTSLSTYGDPASPLFCVVWTLSSGKTPKWAWNSSMRGPQYQAFFDAYSSDGYVITAVTTIGHTEDVATYSAVAVRMSMDSWFARSACDTACFSAANDDALAGGLALISAAVYGTPEARLFAGVWAAVSALSLWSFTTTPTDYVNYYLAAEAIPLRVSMLVPAEDGSLLATYRDDMLLLPEGRSPYYGSLDQPQLEFLIRDMSADGFIPIDLHGFGTTPAAARFSVIFAANATPITRVWSVSSGGDPPSPHAPAIDAAFSRFMTGHGIRAGSVSVARGNELLLQQAYTWAEPSYPITTPRSMFRLASVSKAFTCAAISTLVERGALSFSALVFPLLGITIPGVPSMQPDPRINDISVLHLLDHAGGWLPNSPGGFDPEFNLGLIADELGLPGCLVGCVPVNKTQVAAFMYGMPLQFTPGTEDYDSTGGASYSNFGYILLGLVVEAVSGVSYVDFITGAVLPPLGLPAGSVNLSSTLASGRAVDEVLYHSIGVGPPATVPLSFAQAQGLLAPWAYAGDGALNEVMDSGGGLMSTPSALVQFAGVWPTWGWGRGPGGARDGSMPGTFCVLEYLGTTASGGNLSLAFVLNTRDVAGGGPTLDTFTSEVVDLVRGLPW